MGTDPTGRRTSDEQDPSRLNASLERAPHRLLVAGVATVALVLLVAFATVILRSERSGRQSLEERAVQRTVVTQHFIEAYIDDLQATMRSHADLALAAPATSAEELALVNEMMRFRTGALLDGEGRVLQAVPSGSAAFGEDLAVSDDHLDRAVGGEATVSGVIPSSADGAPIVDVAVPFAAGDGRRVYRAGYAVNDTPLGPYLLNGTVVAGEALYLVDDAGTIIASSDAATATDLQAEDPELASASAGQQRGTFTTDDGDRFFSSLPVAGAPWRIVRVLPTAAMYAPAEQGRWIPWLLFGGFVAVGVASIVMLSAIIRQRDREHRRARHDVLTGLANRRSTDDLLAVLVDRPAGATPWSVLMIDVDHFKAVNDVHGHHRGDEVLAGVAAVIQGAVRPIDLVGRWGGEEFMVVLDGADLAIAATTAERIRAEVAGASIAGVAITISVGYASTDSSLGDAVVDLADASLLRAKVTGRNRAVTLDPSEAFPARRATPNDGRPPPSANHPHDR